METIAALRKRNSDLASEKDSLNLEISLLHSDYATLQDQKSEGAKVCWISRIGVPYFLE